jgi:hypothetical protein
MIPLWPMAIIMAQMNTPQVPTKYEPLAVAPL